MPPPPPVPPATHRVEVSEGLAALTNLTNLDLSNNLLELGPWVSQGAGGGQEVEDNLVLIMR